MTHEECARQVVEMQDTLYHVSATLLRRECDREDAVQEAIATALTKLTALREESAFPGGMSLSGNFNMDHLPQVEETDMLGLDSLPEEMLLCGIPLK